jgi:hypothetical protein
MRRESELRCEEAGAVIINVDGKNYAVNGMAGQTPITTPLSSLMGGSCY